MKKNILLFCFSLLTLSSFVFYSCDEDDDIIPAGAEANIPECYRCESSDNDFEFCYADIVNSLEGGGEFVAPVELEGADMVGPINDIIARINEGSLELTEVQVNDAAVLFYWYFLVVSIQSENTCYTQSPCECEEGQNKVLICHVPPGNPGNAKTKSVSCNALDAHLASGSFCGDCESMGFDQEIDMSNIEEYIQDQICLIFGEDSENCENSVISIGG